MRSILAYVLLAAAVSAAPRPGNTAEDDCSMVWVTVYGDVPSGSVTGDQLAASTSANPGKDTAGSAATTLIPVKVKDASGGDMRKAALQSPPSGTSSDAAEAASIAIRTSSSASAADTTTPPAAAQTTPVRFPDESSALSLPTRPDGSAPLPVNGKHISAPVATDPIPLGAATYTPPNPGVFDNADFANWTDKQKTGNNLPSKWMVVAPGSYRYKPGQVMPAGTDANTVRGENLVLYNFPAGWTLDIRGVTFIIDITDENKNQRPAVMIYVIQAENMTILGGTIWVDQGELFTQARIISVGAPDSDGNNMLATMEVEQGYNLSAWRTAGPRNQRCVDDSDPNHFKDPGCNFWYASNYDFSTLESKRTFTAIFASRAGIKKGYVLTMENGLNSYIAVSSEDNSGTHVKGLTTNGNMMSIGLNSGQVAPVFENVYLVNPPPRPGFAPRVEGPALSWGNIGGFIYDTPGQVLSKLPGSFWQYSGCEKDLQVAGNNTVPS
ncbi:hypothetical protein N7G274_005684 [Stereocaulon virgatum]|uniref:Uncharacterized protein n=1 Tax=Stereocaulon virgatum TaxID=373712 RepID=A0ABR4A5W8_9LECA